MIFWSLFFLSTCLHIFSIIKCFLDAHKSSFISSFVFLSNFMQLFSYRKYPFCNRSFFKETKLQITIPSDPWFGLSFLETHACTHTCLPHTCMHTRTCTCLTHTTYMYAHTHMHTASHMQAHIPPTHTHTCMYACTHTHTHKANFLNIQHMKSDIMRLVPWDRIKQAVRYDLMVILIWLWHMKCFCFFFPVFRMIFHI